MPELTVEQLIVEQHNAYALGFNDAEAKMAPTPPQDVNLAKFYWQGYNDNSSNVVNE